MTGVKRIDPGGIDLVEPDADDVQERAGGDESDRVGEILGSAWCDVSGDRGGALRSARWSRTNRWARSAPKTAKQRLAVGWPRWMSWSIELTSASSGLIVTRSSCASGRPNTYVRARRQRCC